MALGSRRIDVDVVANDRATPVYNRIAVGADAAFGRISRGITGVNNSFRTHLNTLNSSMNALNNYTRQYNNAMATVNRVTQVALIGAGYLIYRFTKDSISKFADFERQHAKTMGAIASNYDQTAKAQSRFFTDQKRLKEEALKIGTVGFDGRGSLYNPTQVSSAQTALVKAGFKSQNVSSVLPSVIKFAGGNDIQLDTATDYAVNVGEMFGVKRDNKSYTKMLDMMTRAADVSTIDVPDLFESLKYAGGITGAMKRPLQEVLAMVAVMGNAGLKGSMAGTGIQAFMTRILDPVGTTTSAKTAPTERVKVLLSEFVKSTTDASGKFKDMATVTGNLDKVMEVMNDKEKAWFSHHLFGLFQMKAGYALSNSGGDNLKEVANDIFNKSTGVNDRKWEIMLTNAYGAQTKFQNALYGTKIDIGSRISPTTTAVFNELYKLLTGGGKYKMNYGTINKSIDDSSKLIADKYGPQMGELVKRFGTGSITSGRVLAANEPLAEGYGISVFKLLNGDVRGAIASMSEAIGRANTNINDLPPELQGLARQTRNAALAMMALIGMNFAAKLIETITTLWRFSLGKLITMNASVVNINGGNIRGGGSGGAGGAGVRTITGATAVGGARNTSSVILGANGEPITRAGATPRNTGGVILGANGEPISSGRNARSRAGATAVEAETAMARPRPTVGGTASKAFGVYMIANMLGLDAKVLDKFGMTEGTKGRAIADKVSNGIYTGAAAFFTDQMLLKGAGAKLLGRGVGSGLKLGVNALKGTAGAVISNPLTLIPAAIGAMVFGDMAYQNANLNAMEMAKANAIAKGHKWYEYNNQMPWWNPNGIFMKKGGILDVDPNKKYEGGSTFMSAPPSRKWYEWIPGLGKGYNARMGAYNTANDAALASAQADQYRFKSAQFYYKKGSGKELSYQDYINNYDQWKNHPGINADGSLKALVAYGQTKEQMFGSNSIQNFVSKLIGNTDNLSKSVMNMKQTPPVVNVQPPKVYIDITVDNQGNILYRNERVQDASALDKIFGIFNSRNATK
jgi:TP901 family phage tail tape measure protein